MNLVQVLPVYKTTVATSPSALNYRALVFNLHKANTDFQSIRNFIAETKPTFVVLLELTETLNDATAVKELGYPFAKVLTRTDGFGIGLFSSVPLESADFVLFGPDSLPSIVATLIFNGEKLDLLATHPLPPSSPENYRSRNAHLIEAGQYINRRYKESGNPSIAMMDMNATPWSDIFRDFVAESKLRDSRQGFGIQNSWPSWMPILGIPIDHIFISDELRVSSRTIGPNKGSDHMPVVLDFSI